MTLHFYLNNEAETHIFSMHDVAANPFKEGDIVNLEVSELSPGAYSEYKEEVRTQIRDENSEKRRLFNLKKIKLSKEEKYYDVTYGKLTIEYHCKYV